MLNQFIGCHAGCSLSQCLQTKQVWKFNEKERMKDKDREKERERYCFSCEVRPKVIEPNN
jgi:hypothetical protein